MIQCKANVEWKRNKVPFLNGSYSRKHRWKFDGGLEIPASASPEVVNPRFVDAAAIDPEEAFVASLSSCHMLWFLSLASKKELIIDRYVDNAVGTLAKDQEGKLAITEVILYPVIKIKPSDVFNQHLFEELHQKAHDRCFLARSVKCTVRIDAQLKIR